MAQKQVGPSSPSVETLSIGTMRVYDFGRIKLHAYETKDPFADESYLFETEHELIGLESPLFLNNLSEYTDYITKLNKPVNHFIMAYHGGGGETFSESRVYSTEKAKKSLGDGGSIKKMLDDFTMIFPNKLNTEIPAVTDTIKAGTVCIGGIKFIIKETPESFDLEIPAINVAYTHMVGNKVHNILESQKQIDAMVKRMKDFEKHKPSLILTTHDIPATVEIAQEKMVYLKTIKKIAQTATNKASFITLVKTAFENYTGENYLEMSAESLFPTK